MAITTARTILSTGDSTGTTLTFGSTPPTQGNALFAVFYARGSSITPDTPEGWSLEHSWDDSFNGNVVITRIYTKIATGGEGDIDFRANIGDAPDYDACYMHFYEIVAPADGFLTFAGDLAPIWNKEDGLATGPATISNAVPWSPDMAGIVVGQWAEPITNPSFGGLWDDLDFQDDRFVTGFHSVTPGEWGSPYSFDVPVSWTGNGGSGTAAFFGLILNRTKFSKVQKATATGATAVLDQAPVVDNLLIASLAVLGQATITAPTGWGLIESDPTASHLRSIILYRQVRNGDDAQVAFAFPGLTIRSVVVEEWTGFEGTPTAGTPSQSTVGASTAWLNGTGVTMAGGDRIIATAFSALPTPTSAFVVGGSQNILATEGEPVTMATLATAVVTDGINWYQGANWSPQGDGVVVQAQFYDATQDAGQAEDIAFTFPEEGQRLMYAPGVRRGSALTSVRGTEIFVYADPEGAVPADISDLNDVPYEDSKLVVDENSTIPRFKGPVGVTTLYARIAGTTDLIPVFANLQSWRDWLAGGGAGGVRLDEANTWTARQSFEGSTTSIPIAPGIDFEIEIPFGVRSELDDPNHYRLLSGITRGFASQLFDTVFAIYGAPGLDLNEIAGSEEGSTPALVWMIGQTCVMIHHATGHPNSQVMFISADGDGVRTIQFFGNEDQPGEVTYKGLPATQDHPDRILTFGTLGNAAHNIYDTPFPAMGATNGSFESYPTWDDLGPTVGDEWTSQDPNSLATPFKGIAPIVPCHLKSNGLVTMLCGSLLGPATLNTSFPIVTLPVWAYPDMDWNATERDGWRLRWVTMDGDEVWHVIRTDYNVEGFVRSIDGKVFLANDEWPVAPPDGADSVIIDFGVSGWINYRKAIPAFSHRARSTYVLDQNPMLDPKVGSYVFDGECLPYLPDAGTEGAVDGVGLWLHAITPTTVQTDSSGQLVIFDGTDANSFSMQAHSNAYVQVVRLPGEGDVFKWFVLYDSTSLSGGATTTPRALIAGGIGDGTVTLYADQPEVQIDGGSRIVYDGVVAIGEDPNPHSYQVPNTGLYEIKTTLMHAPATYGYLNLFVSFDGGTTKEPLARFNPITWTPSEGGGASSAIGIHSASIELIVNGGSEVSFWASALGTEGDLWAVLRSASIRQVA